MAAKKDLVPARILTELLLDGATYKPGQLVGLPTSLAGQLEKMGSIDTNKDAVAACKAGGFELVEHDPVIEE